MSPILVFGKPGCPQCKITDKILKESGVPYEYLDVTEDADAYARVEALGYQSLPVTVDGENHWTGLVPDLLKKAISARSELGVS